MKALLVFFLFLPGLLVCKILYRVEDFTESDVFYNSIDYHPEDYIDSFTDFQKHDYFQY